MSFFILFQLLEINVENKRQTFTADVWLHFSNLTILISYINAMLPIKLLIISSVLNGFFIVFVCT